MYVMPCWSGGVFPAVLLGGEPGEVPAGEGGSVPYGKILSDASGFRRKPAPQRFYVVDNEPHVEGLGCASQERPDSGGSMYVCSSRCAFGYNSEQVLGLMLVLARPFIVTQGSLCRAGLEGFSGQFLKHAWTFHGIYWTAL